MVCPLDLEGQPLNSELDRAHESSSGADSDSTTEDSCGIDSMHMRKAALYARVSTEGQSIEVKFLNSSVSRALEGRQPRDLHGRIEGIAGSELFAPVQRDGP